jgi:ATP-dependent RNA helicase DeaD
MQAGGVEKPGASCCMDKLRFTELGLSEDILKAVDKMGFEEASPIQSAVIPTILQGRDVVGMSSTGSGKTVAFAIPAIEKVDPKVRAVQVLILCPTRELAVQVAEETGKIAHFKRGVMGVPIYGGQSYERQFRALAAGAQVVIGTPGRVMDHMERGTLKLDSLKMVVLDETDRSTRRTACSTWVFAMTSSTSSRRCRQRGSCCFFPRRSRAEFRI